MKYLTALIIIMCFLLLTGCSKTMEEEHAGDMEQWVSVPQITENEAMGTTGMESITAPKDSEYKYQQMPDLEVDYLSATDWRGICMEHPFVCWQDMLIIGNTVYRRENGIYRQTEESLQDRLHLEDDLDCYSFNLWENLLIVYGSSNNRVSVFNSDFEQLVSYTIEGFIEFIFQGKIYYRNQDGKGIFCMDLLSEEVKVIYEGEGVSCFLVRDNGDIIFSVINESEEDRQIWEYWLFTYDAQGEWKADKIWETDKYKYMEMREFNNRGLFFIGEYYSAEYDILCLYDNGEIEEMRETSRWPDIITEEGFFRCDSQIIAEEEKEAILGSWSWGRPGEAQIAVTVIDGISYYDFGDNKLGTWQLIDDEMLKIDYHLAAIVYNKGEITAFYENEELNDLYISKVQLWSLPGNPADDGLQGMESLDRFTPKS